MEVATLLKGHGANVVSAACTHGVLSGPALERLEHSALNRLIVTDTLPMHEPRSDKIDSISVAPLLGEAIRRIHTGQSVGALFG